MSVSVLPLCCFVTLGRLFKLPTSMHMQVNNDFSFTERFYSLWNRSRPLTLPGICLWRVWEKFFFSNEQWRGPCSVDYILHQKEVLHGNYIPRILLVVAALKTIEGEDVAGPSWRLRPDFILLDAFKPSEQILIFLPATQLVSCSHCKGKMEIG